jgi:hypothetical protein
MELTFDKLELDSPNCMARVAAREQMNKFQEACDKHVAEGAVVPAYKHTHHFSDKHPVFGCHIYGRELFVPANSVLTGKIHKHPTMNILLKGKLVVVSEEGRKIVEAPATYMAKAGERKVGYTLEDCLWVTVILSETAGEENINDIVDFQTTMSYADLGLMDSVAAAQLVHGGT